MTEQRDSTDDWIMITLCLFGVGGFGLFSASSFLEPLRIWLVQVGVLVEAPGLVWEIAAGTGLDLARVIIGAGLVLGLLVALIAVVRVKRARDV